MLWARRSGTDRLTLFADADAPSAARLASHFTFPIEVREVHGASSRECEPEPLPVVMPGPDGAEDLLGVLRSHGVETVLEDGSWRGELLGLEVARLVVWPEETGGDGRLHLEPGVGRFDRDAAAALHGGEDPERGLERAIATVAAARHPGADTNPLSLLARARWLRAASIAEPSKVGVAHLEAIQTTFPATSVRDDAPAAALGRRADGTVVVVVFASGPSLQLVPVAADTRALHAPEAELLLAVPGRDRHPAIDDLAGLVRGGAGVVDVPTEWG